MKILDKIKKQIINILDPNLNQDYEKLKIDNISLKEQYESLEIINQKLEKDYDKKVEYDKVYKAKMKDISNINKLLKNHITQFVLQVLQPKLIEMPLNKLEFVYNDLNYEEKALKKEYKDYKLSDIELEIYLSKGNLINDASQELLGKEKIWELFPEEDARGTFEFANGYDLTKWREYYHFGKVANIEYIKCYEFYKYKLDYSDPNYADYKKKLYIAVIPKEIEKYITYILEDNPDILYNTNQYIDKLEKRFTAYIKEKEQNNEEIQENKEDIQEESEDEEEGIL